MARIIKATEHDRGVRQAAFHLDDMTARANQYLGEVRAEAARITAQAHEEAEAIRRQAEAEGRQAAQGSIDQLVAAEAERHLRTAMPALRHTVKEIERGQDEWRGHWEKQSIHLAVAIAAKVVRRELSRQPEIPLELVREALELAAGSPQLRIRLNPADRRALGVHIEELVNEMAPLASAEFVADQEITLGGCRVETQFGVIDQQFEAQLARIEEELS